MPGAVSWQNRFREAEEAVQTGCSDILRLRRNHRRIKNGESPLTGQGRQADEVLANRKMDDYDDDCDCDYEHASAVVTSA